MRLSRHAESRYRQRGYRPKDLPLIEEYGTVTADGIYMRRKDAEAAIRSRKKEIAALERIQGTLLVVEGETVITVQRARRWKEKALLRRSVAAGPRRKRYIHPAELGGAGMAGTKSTALDSNGGTVA